LRNDGMDFHGRCRIECLKRRRSGRLHGFMRVLLCRSDINQCRDSNALRQPEPPGGLHDILRDLAAGLQRELLRFFDHSV